MVTGGGRVEGKAYARGRRRRRGAPAAPARAHAPCRRPAAARFKRVHRAVIQLPLQTHRPFPAPDSKNRGQTAAASTLLPSRARPARGALRDARLRNRRAGLHRCAAAARRGRARRGAPGAARARRAALAAPLPAAHPLAAAVEAKAGNLPQPSLPPLGSHTVLALLEHGHSVTMIDNLSNSHAAAFDHMRRLAGARAGAMKFLEVGDAWG
jgi:hypothetical protein